MLRMFKFDPVEFVQLKTCRNDDLNEKSKILTSPIKQKQAPQDDKLADTARNGDKTG